MTAHPGRLRGTPIGRCACGGPYSDLSRLNCRCECGGSVVASVAAQDWRPCPPCFGSGKSLIWSDFPECPVCCGAGWITEDDVDLADDELGVVRGAVEVYEHGPWPPRAASLVKSQLGSVSLLRENWSEAMLAALKRALATMHIRSGGVGRLPQRVDFVARPKGSLFSSRCEPRRKSF
jgi:hypothetical protein